MRPGATSGTSWRAAAAAFLLAAVSPCLLAASPSKSPSPGPAVDPIDAPSLKSLLESERGRVVVLNFWATWCDPCREEFPDLVRVAREYGGKVLLVAVSLDDPDTVEAQVRPFLGRAGFLGRALVKSGGDPDAFINGVDPEWSGALPATFVQGPDGKRVKSIHGATSYAALKAIVDPLVAAAR